MASQANIIAFVLNHPSSLKFKHGESGQYYSICTQPSIITQIQAWRVRPIL
jgi:hypothetical protein